MSIIEQALEIQIQSWLTKKMVSKKKKKEKMDIIKSNDK